MLYCGMEKHPINQPKHKYSYGFKRDNGCYCSTPCGEWLLYHETIDMQGKAWTNMGTSMNSKEAILEKIVKEKLPTEWADYVPYKAQALLLPP